MYSRFIFIKSKQKMTSPFFIDFLKSLLGANIKIEENNNVLTIFHDCDNDNDISESLESLISEYDEDVNIFISSLSKYQDEELNIIKNYFNEINLSKFLYTEKELIKELILSGYKKDLNKIVFKEYSNDINFLDTLKVFIENDMNTSSSAKILFMHRNTLINKLEKFTNITGYDVKKFSDAFIVYYLLK